MKRNTSITSTVNTSEVTVAIPVFTRTEQLRHCLASVPEECPVIVADDGHFEERVSLYREHGVRALYPGYDIGVGMKRKRLSQAVETPYVLFLDPDNRFPTNFTRMYQHLRENPEYGGVSGIYLEGKPRNTAARLIRIGPFLIRTRLGQPSDAEFIGQAMLCRRELFETYTWDSRFRYSREHLDFFYGHARAGEWRFCVLPDVTIPHIHEESDYRKQRDDTDRKQADRERFEQKWNVRFIASPI